METKIRVIVTGTTGIVGEGVLDECFMQTEAVLVINRKLAAEVCNTPVPYST